MTIDYWNDRSSPMCHRRCCCCCCCWWWLPAVVTRLAIDAWISAQHLQPQLPGLCSRPASLCGICADSVQSRPACVESVQILCRADQLVWNLCGGWPASCVEFMQGLASMFGGAWPVPILSDSGNRITYISKIDY
jgi:hypothetical protein